MENNCSANNQFANESIDGNRKLCMKDEVGFNTQWDMFPLVLAVFIVAINSMVITVVIRQKALQNITNYMLTSLAVSDLLTGSLSIPLMLVCSAIRKSTPCTVSTLTNHLTSFSTVIHLLLVTGDRYICILHSLKYPYLVTSARTVVALITAWSVSIFMSLIQLSWFDLREDTNDDASQEKIEQQIIFDIFCLACFFALPFVIMAFAHTRILVCVCFDNTNL